ncbi:RNA polymerase III subunit H [Phyllostomus discolor]|uniref:DNA-directed RNA polymerase subunit n=2 Tax=Phyllostomus discolor TaxID=89673 RepID=A0A834B1Z2_9CHIR|nr:RNA polymerase III subunit H [Phyllostomus discolor]
MQGRKSWGQLAFLPIREQVGWRASKGASKREPQGQILLPPVSLRDHDHLQANLFSSSFRLIQEILVLGFLCAWHWGIDKPPAQARMFVLVEMVDTVRIPPWQFERKLNDSIAEELNKKLANKVVYNVGLCICLFDITKLEDSYVFPGDGASHTKVHFRYVVFHPFLDEILIGKIKGCSPEGVHVSLGFFDDILIPPESLQQPAKFDEAEQMWVWEYETEEGAHDLYMDIGEEVRFRVVDESFVDTSPTGPSSAEAASASEELPKKEAPYTLVGSISEPGLGLLSWWTSS